MFILELCKKIRPCCTQRNPCLQQGRNYDTTLLHWCDELCVVAVLFVKIMLYNCVSCEKSFGWSLFCADYWAMRLLNQWLARFFEKIYNNIVKDREWKLADWKPNKAAGPSSSGTLSKYTYFHSINTRGQPMFGPHRFVQKEIKKADLWKGYKIYFFPNNSSCFSFVLLTLSLFSVQFLTNLFKNWNTNLSIVRKPADIKMFGPLKFYFRALVYFKELLSRKI